jgi:hypothetical protein
MSTITDTHTQTTEAHYLKEQYFFSSLGIFCCMCLWECVWRALGPRVALCVMCECAASVICE